MRRKIIAGNWKMNKTLGEAVDLARDIVAGTTTSAEVDIVLCPPFPVLSAVFDVIKDSPVQLGGQNIYWESKGAFTGEVAAEMLLSVGCRYVILGHSERRSYFYETDETVNRKIGRALETGLIPIVCVGETLKQRQAGETESVIGSQIRCVFAGFVKEQAGRCIIAYEPVWAIGTGVVATPQIAQEVHRFIRDLLVEMYDAELSQGMRIQYGGSMKPDNANELLSQPDIDGGLIGGASLDADSFLGIVYS